ncbi:MAG: hypothetical protein CMN97_06005 [Synechococcus sp. NAT40]|uniref:DUF2237 family protein n=1 Tax=Synechococcus sp. MIT S9451 TaxID=3082543 RepID=UPI000C925E93|nr:hypothetical protein [Synechococcus sp. NAT40]
MLLNVFGEPLLECGCKPITGWYLDGYCRTDPSDLGNHSVCCIMTENFLSYTYSQGNNLIDPIPFLDFPGLKPGDHWCLCSSRWDQARRDGMAPPVMLESTDCSAARVIPLATLKLFSTQNH